MTLGSRKSRMTRHVFGFLLLGGLGANLAAAQAKTEARPAASSPCRVEPADYRGWQAQQISNHWVQLTIVPQNGGRLMQVTFAGHPYFFVNPKYAGKYLPPGRRQMVQLWRRQAVAPAGRK